MVTVELKLYTINELSEDAREVAFECLRRAGYSENHWAHNNFQALKEFMDQFSIEFGRGYSSNAYDYDYKYRLDNTILELKGLRLRTWLVNNYSHLYYLPKRFVKGRCVRNSKVLLQTYDCPLTGMCIDYALLNPIELFIANPNKHTSLEDLLWECTTAWKRDCELEDAYCDSEEYLTEMCDFNEILFTESGKIHN